MPKYFKAATNTVKVPKKMVFLDSKGQTHLYDTLTPKHHIASHYGQSAIITDYNTKPGNLLKVSKGEYTKYTEKVKKQKKAAKDLVQATNAVETAVKKMRGRPRKNPNDTTPKKSRNPLTEEQKKERAAKRAMTLANKALSKQNMLKQDKTDLITKLNASVMANDIFNDLLPAAIASIPNKKRGRPVGSGKKKAQ